MISEPEIVLAVAGTGAALAALIMAQSAARRRGIADLRKNMHRELGGIRERLARLEGAIDIIRVGMQLPHPVPVEEPGTGS